jgi:hypothetical protein
MRNGGVPSITAAPRPIRTQRLSAGSGGECSGRTFRGGWVYTQRPKSASALSVPSGASHGAEFDLVGRARFGPLVAAGS